VVDLPRAGSDRDGGAAAVLSDADQVLLVVPARLRAATAARLLLEAPGSPWAAAGIVVRAAPGGLSREDCADLLGRPVAADLPFDRSAVPRGERGEPPVVSPRSPLGGLARRVLAGLPAR